MGIDARHSEYEAAIEGWQKIDNVCDGNNVEQYLVYLNRHDKTPENRERNEAYRERAVFYPIAGRTAAGLNALLFSEPPTITMPDALNYLLEDADGAGVSIFQQSQDVGLDVICIGRAALFVSYPNVEGPLSKADMETGRYFATIHEIEAEQIINWRVSKVGAKTMLSLVVFEEDISVVEPDGYKVESVKQLRELRLENGMFFDRAWQKDKEDKWQIVSEHMPLDGSGNPWREIPFTFIGAMSNSPDVDSSIMAGLASLNIAHYRNSADYEDSVWFVGQAQPWMSGVTQNHIDMMKKNDMYIGSRNMLGVPSGETFSFASAPPNTMVREAMADKVVAMIGLGARYIQPGGVAKTAAESNNDNAVQHSALSLISRNISDAYTQAIVWVAEYMNVAKNNEFGLEAKSDFIQVNATAQDIQAIIAGYVQGAIPVSDYFDWMKKRQLVDNEKTLDEFTAEIGSPTMPDLGGQQ